MGKVYATMLTVWCLWSVVHAQGTGVLAGRVLDAQGKPVSGATDENGRITLDVAAGSVTLMPGFSPFSPTLGTAGLFRAGTGQRPQNGRVVDAADKPVIGAKVTLLFGREAVYQISDGSTQKTWMEFLTPLSTSTDKGGRFALKGMPSALLLVPRIQNLLWRQIRVKPSRDLVLTVSTTRPPWEAGGEPAAPNVEKLLRSVEWLQPVQWQGKDTLLVFTAPYLAQNEMLLQTVKRQLREGWQVATVLDTTSRQEAERYRQQIGLDIPVGYWKRGATRPIAPALPRILPSLPYVVHIGQDGKPHRHGIATDELPKLVGALP